MRGNKQKQIIFFVILISIFLAFRLILPGIILSRVNLYLETFSPMLAGHIADIDLALLRGAGKAKNMTMMLRKSDKTIINLQSVEVSVAWRELLKGKVMLDFNAENAHFFVSKLIFKDLKKIKKTMPKDKKKFPLSFARMEIKNSQVTLEDYQGFRKNEKLRITKINSIISNLSPTKKNPFSFYTFDARIQGEAPIKASGKIDLKAKPMDWDFDGSVNSFNLPEANIFLKKKLPLTFTKGHLDVFVEARSQNGKVEGYVKPFMKDLDVIRTKENFKGPKHWAIEVITAISNIILKNPGKNSVATKIPFQFESKFKIDSGEALHRAIQHGYEERLKPGIENKYDLE